MDSAALRKSLQDWERTRKATQQQLIPRLHRQEIPFPLGLALLGVRRCGKTYAAIEIASREDGEVLYYNFEDPAFVMYNEVGSLDQLLTVAAEMRPRPPKTLVLDEIQNVTGWEKWIRKILDQREHRVIVTGSSAHLLSRELGTAVTGRCLERHIWPLSFPEFLNFSERQVQRPLDGVAALSAYLTWGGFPEVVLAADHQLRLKILRQYLSDVMYRDVLQRSGLRNRRSLDQIVTYYLTNLSSLHSYSSLKRAFDIGVDTAEAVTQALVDAFLVFEVQRYHPNLKVQSRDPRKVYAVDTGLRNVGARSPQEDRGKLLENAVFTELKRRDRDVCYFKAQRETDFVVTEGFKPVEAIQVCASDLADTETQVREISALEECLTSLKLKEGTIVTWDREDLVKLGGGRSIHMVPAYNWLRR